MARHHGSAAERRWHGAPLLSHGFRPFFLGGALFAVVAILLWLGWLGGLTPLPGPLAPVDWHVHEMLFGYVGAIVAGFLFTAVPNWTGRLPVAGWPLAGIAGLWLAGRLAMLLPLPPGAAQGLAAGVEALFLPALAGVMANEIIGGRNTRNLKVLLPLSVLATANLWFHWSAMTGADTGGAVRMGFAAILFLISLIGGRIIPSFTRNWLVRQGPGRLPVPFNRFDAATVAATGVALLVWVIWPGARLVAVLMAVLALLHLARLARWAGERTLVNGLLVVLHVFYLFLPLGFLALALAGALEDPAWEVAAMHLFGIGAAGGMTLAVMTRASQGHTGRELESGPLLNLMFALVALAACLRVAAALLPAVPGLTTWAGLAWVAAFGLFAFRVGPWLMRPRVKG